MKLNLGRMRILWIAFIAICALLVANTWFLLQAVRLEEIHRDWVFHSHEVLREMQALRTSINQTESEMRLRQLRGKDGSVGLDVPETAIWSHFSRVQTLIRDNPEQSQNLITLHALIQKRLDLLNTNTTIAREKPRRSPEFLASLSEGADAMVAVTQQIDRMAAIEGRLVGERNARMAESSRLTNFSIWSAGALSLVLASLAFAALRRGLLRQEADLESVARERELRASEARAVKIVAGEPAITKAATEICAFFSESLNAPAAGFFSLSEGGPRFEGGVGIPSDVQALHPGTINEIASRAGDIKQIEVPPDYFYISSGLGRAQPRYLTFIPIESRPGERAAIVELALFERLSADKLAWLRVMRAALGPGIGSALSRRQLNDLLEETQVQAEELQVQQEELRATNEEIAAKATELERANRYKSDFLSRMSHELRTPLNSLLTLATLLGENREGTLTPRQLEFARTIHSSGEDLLSLINDVLDFSRLEAGKITPHSEVFSLHDLVERVSKGFKSIAEAKGLAFEVRFAEGSADQVNGDPRLIQQILRNFVSNAVKFTDHGRVSVLVGTSPRDPHFVRLTVSDTGIGIPEEKRSAIFEAFEQADTSTSRRYGGSGLGLTIARDFTRVLGGDVGVRSQEGEGSEFWADLPLPVASLTAHAAPKADHVDRLTQKILLAEGDPSLRALMTATAEARGYNVIEAEDTQQVLRILETETPSAILIDTRFDSGTGPRLREKIRAIKRLDAIPVQLIGEVTESNAETEIQNATIANPARPESVLSALKQVARSQIKKLKRLLIVESLGQKNSSTQPLESLLRNENVELHTASTAAEATKAMTSQDFDCVILDLALPDRSGFDLLQSFATEQPEKLPPVIVYTSRAIGKDEEERLRRYAESIIIKGPKSPERLLDEVSLFLHRVETALPSEKRTSLERQRQRERTFEGRSILVADDDLRSVFTIVSLLEAKGFKVLIARDGEEALAKLEQRPPPDAVLMDIMMPKIDGYETIRRIRTHGDMQSIPIIALTAKTMKGEAERCFAAGANAYLAKPLDIPRLLATLNSFIQPSPESTREQGSNEEQRALRT